MTEVINDAPKRVNKTADKAKYHREYMTTYRELNKEKIERQRVIATCNRKHIMPSNRAIRIHKFSKEELDNFLSNCSPVLV